MRLLRIVTRCVECGRSVDTRLRWGLEVVCVDCRLKRQRRQRQLAYLRRLARQTQPLREPIRRA